MLIKTQLHTIYILVGPTMCGKSTFAGQLREALYASMLGHGIQGKARIISSDSLRLHYAKHFPVDKHSPAMLELSEQAFQTLFLELEMSTKYPANNEFVILDSTGLSETFRDKVRDIAKKNHYNCELISFDYSHSVYEKFANSRTLYLIREHAKRFKTEFKPRAGSSLYKQHVKITVHDPKMWADLRVEIANAETYSRTHLSLADDSKPVAVIGDIHESIVPLKELLGKLENHQIVIVGDYLDKGGNTAETVHFIHDLQAKGAVVVHGNHEAFVARRLLKEIEPNPEAEKNYFHSMEVFLKDEELAAKFLEIYKKSVPFFKVTGRNCQTMYVTHAPCLEMYLGKMDAKSIISQRNLYAERREGVSYRENFKFVFEESKINYPLHVFGHIAHNSQYMKWKNKIFVDTGSVYGNKLSAFVLKPNGDHDFVHVNAPKIVDKELDPNFTLPIKENKPFDIRDYDLSVQDNRFLKHMKMNGVKFISGTMAPAASTKTKLEGLDEALNYYKSNPSVSQVIIEPKYMGSRCQLYLYKSDILKVGSGEVPTTKSFAVSRNGFKINPARIPAITDIINKALEYYALNVSDWQDELIIDGELTPWRILGEGLIENEFAAYRELVKSELNMLATDEGFADLQELPGVFDAKHRLELLSVYEKNLQLYGYNEEEPRFRGFSILSLDGNTEVYNSEEDSFVVASSFGGGDDYLVVNLENKDDIDKAHHFTNTISFSRKMEGVVVKPLVPRLKNCAPYLKVRNEEYLTLVYGYDYQTRYETLCVQKHTRGKVNSSISEYELGMKMLKADEKSRVEYAVKMLFEMKKEETLDPRL